MSAEIQDSYDLMVAYDKVRTEQPPDYIPLPAWPDLSLELREAFIQVFFAGAKRGIEKLAAKMGAR